MQSALQKDSHAIISGLLNYRIVLDSLNKTEKALDSLWNARDTSKRHSWHPPGRSGSYNSLDSHMSLSRSTSSSLSRTPTNSPFGSTSSELSPPVRPLSPVKLAPEDEPILELLNLRGLDKQIIACSIATQTYTVAEDEGTKTVPEQQQTDILEFKAKVEELESLVQRKEEEKLSLQRELEEKTQKMKKVPTAVFFQLIIN